MKRTDQTLLEQMRITEFEITNRKLLFNLGDTDFEFLRKCKTFIEPRMDELVDAFYEMQTSVPEIALLIGDADTLFKLKNAQRKYLLDLFSGLYDLEYVNNRLRIGLVHKRIGVEPKLYLSAINTLKKILTTMIREEIKDSVELIATLGALDKLFLFDITLVFETYIRSLVSEIESSKEKSESYALVLEETVMQRTQQLETMSRTDALTGLLNVRTLLETLTVTLRAAERRSESVSVVYIDINDFKIINDTQGHHKGDDILRAVGESIKKVSRVEDSCFRYGGDEFCIVLPECKAEEAHDIYVTRLRLEVNKIFKHVTLSIGIVDTGPDTFEEADVLIRKADEKMYLDKKEHKARSAL
ncbi:diguanylate cyclase, possibly oxygen sensing (GGDEF & globin domain) [Sulfurimonas gotlandica GD1]|jgi:diguanylate cyclase|uniref:Diguanylate cyclase DosC n=1 Tax=Sulfurimonas gotlandica (strain DSM 19862 / JCM 16533 / GD1) TaxID=929558 RepID=B6BGM2_SULGG|nr:protoglobin domain-containing protein [Sulfurimonas gotlandica]EDZ63109.1 sensor histidine kinase [Sulfurimonas gotlandica GD1]EHP29652.1 diguanylate cyclase, possibly oxygen sensing (GGDEF & globin domain) [Sulfurimonas gotlandica GD1]